VLSTGVLNVSTQGSTGATGGSSSSASVANVSALAGTPAARARLDLRVHRARARSSGARSTGKRWRRTLPRIPRSRFPTWPSSSSTSRRPRAEPATSALP
jgi:hypothetical protein